MTFRTKRNDAPKSTLIDRQELEWLAGISPRHAQELRRLESEESAAARERELLAFTEAISERPWSRRDDRPDSRELLEFVAEITGRGPCRLREWNEADHPRTGTKPNPGEFASKGGALRGGNLSSGGDTQSTGKGFFNVPAERVQARIRRASGKNWSGDRVLDALQAIAPEWVSFFKQHLTLARASDGDKGASTSVHIGENGPDVNEWPGAINDPGHKTIHVAVPEAWNDAQIVHYLLTQLADHSDAHRLAAQWATDKPEQFQALRNDRFRNGLTTVAALAQGYYGALAGLAPGGGAAVAAWDIQQGNYLGAALSTAFMLPLGKIAKSAVESGGTIALRAGDKLVAALPVKLIERVQKLRPEQRALLNHQLLAAKTVEDAVAAVKKFVNLPFDRHHPLPKFLGGDLNQHLAKIPRSIHNEFHAELRRELKATGFNLPIGSRGGSTDKWVEHFLNNPGSQTEAFNAVLRVSERIDKKHKTNLTDFALKNLIDENHLSVP